MGLIVYPAVVIDADPTDLQASFPDFPGVSIRASAPSELMLRGRERLSQALREFEKAGMPWPTPSSLAQARATHPDPVGAVVWVDVQVEDAPVRVTISLGERLLARIDAAAEEHAMTRSGYLAAAARRQIAIGGSPLDGPIGQKLYEEVAAAGRRIQETLGPDSPVGRTLADLDAIALDGLRRVAGGMSDAFRRRGPSKASAAPDPEPASVAEADGG